MAKSEYNNEGLFQEYAKMSRSRLGLSGAGEWSQLRPLFPKLEGKKMLDLGCGYGLQRSRALCAYWELI